MFKFLQKLWTVGVLCGLVLQEGALAVPSMSVTNPVVTLYELETNIVTLTTATCTDPGANPAPVIKFGGVTTPGGASSSCSNCFNVYPGATGNQYELKFLPGQGTLNYDQANNYFVTLRCESDNPVQSVEQIVDIRLEPNTPPYFTIGSTTTTSINNAENVQAGQSLYQATCIDNDQDPLQYTLTTNPSSNLFTIGTTDGIIRAAGALAAECNSQIAFEVTCKDPYHAAVGPVTIQATLNNRNDRPTITGMNTQLDVPEDTAVDTTLITYTVTDNDATTCSISTSPLDSLQFFKIGASGGTIQVRSTLNYEQVTTRNTNITVTCTDGFCTSEKAYLYVRVTDVNEPIELYPKDFTLTTYEGQISLDPGWTPIDEDQNDYPTYTIVGGNTNGRFSIDPSSGLITSNGVYDVDQGAMPTTDMIVVQAEDIAGHTSTTTVSLTILDANDNRPVFTQQAQQFTITDCASSIGVPFGTVAATDDDSSFESNNVITYSGGNGPITIGSTGSIIPNGLISGGNTYVVSAQATDAGRYPNGPLSANPAASITVIVTTCPTTTTPAPTTTPKPVTTTQAPATTKASSSSGSNSTNSTDENLGWIVIAALLGTALLAALAFMTFKYCWPAYCATGRPNMIFDRMCGNCCETRPPPRAVQPVRGQPPKAGNKNFWQERYPDDDYKNQPDRDRTPSPAPIEGGGPLYALENSTWRPRALQY